MEDFLKFFAEKVKTYPMHLEITYSKVTDWGGPGVAEGNRLRRGRRRNRQRPGLRRGAVLRGRAGAAEKLAAGTRRRLLTMANVKTYTLTLDAQELHDLIEAAMVCECQAAQIINGLKRKGLDLDAQKLVTQNARLSRLVRRMQEAKA